MPSAWPWERTVVVGAEEATTVGAGLGEVVPEAPAARLEPGDAASPPQPATARIAALTRMSLVNGRVKVIIRSSPGGRSSDRTPR